MDTAATPAVPSPTLADVVREVVRALPREREPTADCFGAGCCPYIIGAWNCGTRCCGVFWALAILGAFIATVAFLFLSLGMPGHSPKWFAPFVTVGFLLLVMTLMICCGTCVCMLCTGRGRTKSTHTD